MASRDRHQEDRLRDIERQHQLDGLNDMLARFKIQSANSSGSRYDLERLSVLCDTMAEFLVITIYQLHRVAHKISQERNLYLVLLVDFV